MDRVWYLLPLPLVAFKNSLTFLVFAFLFFAFLCSCFLVDVSLLSSLCRCLPPVHTQSSTGRADYFGALPNLAARVCAQAAPGQVLLDCHPGVLRAMPWSVSAGLHEDGSLVAMLGQGSGCESGIEMVRVGQFCLKGFEDRPTVLCQVRSRCLCMRTFATKQGGRYARQHPRFWGMDVRFGHFWMNTFGVVGCGVWV